jgi:hypothetical protein
MPNRCIVAFLCIALLLGLLACGAAPSTTTPPAPVATQTVAPFLMTPTPMPTVDTAGLSEAELAGTIDGTALELNDTSRQAVTCGEQAAADGVYTLEEITTWYGLLTYTEQLIYELDYYIQQYDMVYEGYASAYVTLLQDLETDLGTLDGHINTISDLLEQGESVVQSSAGQINVALGGMAANLPEFSGELTGLADAFTQSLAERKTWVESFPATDIAATRLGAINAARAYVQALQNAVADALLTPAELQQIAQLSANARASLLAAGGELAALASQVDSLTQLAASAGSLAELAAQINALLGALSSLP